jgi:hypothetical protein
MTLNLAPYSSALSNEVETKTCSIILLCSFNYIYAAKPKSFPSRRRISPESILVESVDITSHEAEFVAPQMIQVIP